VTGDERLTAYMSHAFILADGFLRESSPVGRFVSACSGCGFFSPFFSHLSTEHCPKSVPIFDVAQAPGGAGV
jgi:hypothetical protein